MRVEHSHRLRGSELAPHGQIERSGRIPRGTGRWKDILLVVRVQRYVQKSATGHLALALDGFLRVSAVVQHVAHSDPGRAKDVLCSIAMVHVEVEHCDVREAVGGDGVLGRARNVVKQAEPLPDTSDVSPP